MRILAGKSVFFWIVLVLIISIFCQYSTNSTKLISLNSNDSSHIDSNNTPSDAWLTLELISWQGNSSTTWDNDGTDMDVQFQICIDLDGDSDGISPLCTWTEVWNNTLTLSNAWETTFDLIEDNTTLNITIECWDNDEFADELGNGPDACDMNPVDDEWRLYYETNWSNISTETFSGDGSKDNDTQWGNAESTWKVSIIYYGDDDSDGISNNIDICSETNLDESVDGEGCSLNQYDWDRDGVTNENDQCPTLPGESCYAGSQYILSKKYSFTQSSGSGYSPPILYGGGVSHYSWDISPDGKYLASIIDSYKNQDGLLIIDLETGTENFVGGWTLDLIDQRIGFTPDGKYLLRSFVYSPSSYVYVYDATTYNEIVRITITDACAERPSGGGSGSVPLSFSANSLIAKIRCPWDQADVYLDLESLSLIGTLDGSEERGFLFGEFNDNLPLRIDLSNTIVTGNVAGGEGFEINRNGESLVVNFDGSREVVRISATDDGNSLFVLSADQVYRNYGESNSYNETIEIYNLSTGLVINLPIPEESSYNSERSRLLGGIISSNGLRAVVNYDGGWHVYERDTDFDGFSDPDDACPNVEGNFSGCPTSDYDSDSDRVPEIRDICSHTPLNVTVNVDGCSSSQLDQDMDGISDMSDLCPYTTNNSSVDADGCAFDIIDIIEFDSDNDTIRDSLDECNNTTTGSIVDSTGCDLAESVENPENSGLTLTEWFGVCFSICCIVIVLIPYLFYAISKLDDDENQEVELGSKSSTSSVRNEPPKNATCSICSQRFKGVSEFGHLARNTSNVVIRTSLLTIFAGPVGLLFGLFGGDDPPYRPICPNCCGRCSKPRTECICDNTYKRCYSCRDMVSLGEWKVNSGLCYSCDSADGDDL